MRAGGWLLEPRRAGRTGIAFLLLAGFTLAPACAARAEAVFPDTVRAPQYFPPLERAPLDPPLRLSGSFGEYRPGHFHAGLDLSTGERVGAPVYAALPGYVMRVRASGVGYGRSLYVQADDGRLLVYGHLDAFEEPLASFVAAAQDSSGQYEQDLWPGVTRFRVQAGQRLGWSGRSGTDAPHLHFEIRRGDVAYNPLLAGVTVEDTLAPVFGRVTIDPVRSPADTAWGDSPRTFDCSGSDTALVVGVERLSVEAVDARADGRFTMAPWRIVLQGNGLEVECRFDSVSWAGGMPEVDFVYDRGRAMPQGRHAVLLWAPAGFRPRVLRARAPRSQAAGDLVVPPGSRPLGLRLLAQDVAGHVTVETLALGHGPAGPPGPGIPPGIWVDADSASSGGRPGFRWDLAPGTLFEAARLASADLGRPDAPDELRPRSHAFALLPALTPLRQPLRVAIDDARPRRNPGAASSPAVGKRGLRDTAAASSGVGLYRDSGEGWEYLGAGRERGGDRIVAETRACGRFALFRDGAAPRIRLQAPPRSAPAGPYARWALEARLDEEGSGVDARASHLVVDGRQVPSEWDAVENRLRWRPLRPPASGRHTVEVVAVDRAGNARRRTGSFVLD